MCVLLLDLIVAGLEAVDVQRTNLKHNEETMKIEGYVKKRERKYGKRNYFRKESGQIPKCMFFPSVFTFFIWFFPVRMFHTLGVLYFMSFFLPLRNSEVTNIYKFGLPGLVEYVVCSSLLRGSLAVKR